MTELTMERFRENLKSLQMKNTLEILDNYLERVVKDELSIVEVLDHIFAEEALSKCRRAYEKQVQMSGFPIKKTLEEFDFSFQPSIDKRRLKFLWNFKSPVATDFVNPEGLGKIASRSRSCPPCGSWRTPRTSSSSVHQAWA
jgi:DNA replication protein DnaC